MKKMATSEFFNSFFRCSARSESVAGRLIPASYRLSLLNDLLQWEINVPEDCNEPAKSSANDN